MKLNFSMIMRLISLSLGLMLILISTSCSSYPNNYRGYMTKAYQVRGQSYQPMSISQALSYEEVGICSWYDESSWFGFKRGTTALGEEVKSRHLIGAHKTLPLPCMVEVENIKNGKKINIRINDRGPFIAGRLLDVSPKVAKKLDFYEQGLTLVSVRVLSVGDGKYKRKL